MQLCSKITRRTGSWRRREVYNTAGTAAVSRQCTTLYLTLLSLFPRAFTPTTVTLGSDLPPRTRRERNVALHLNAASWNQKRAVDTPVRKLSDMQSVM
ncbi:hypothetical protein ABG768_017296 [Culter alburnus]|uniref:Uncharacterized protein n=1 Tax=Culter alburnus TaxID=194366 RepID=A0AAW1YZ15_CULAL